MTPHIPKQPDMKLCTDCVFYKRVGQGAPGWMHTGFRTVGVCTAVANPENGFPVDAASVRTGQICGPSGILYVKRVES